MAIQTSIKRSFIFWNVLYIVLCGGLGAWGAYDYWVTIPAQTKAVATYEELNVRRAELEMRGVLWTLLAKKADGTITETESETLEEIRVAMQEAELPGPPPPLTDEEKEEYKTLKKTIEVDFENTAPEPPASYDGWVNFWVYFVGTGILGTPWFVWKLASRRGKVWRLEDDGALSTPEGTFAADQITDINMSIWMKKSIARVGVEGRIEPIILDDYEYENVYLIVGALAHRFHPDDWTDEAKPVKDDEPDDEQEDASDDPNGDETADPSSNDPPEKAPDA
ncbi:MAG: hypothetical protein CMJ27_08445 [Phycisphaerae bacterium]|nr:hypothetical protein [Phycisphaerae bacterium]OUX01234.1 MAG: hypothetical protein CBD91_04850 [Phycisphaeraceae bacterium TMED231]